MNAANFEGRTAITCYTCHHGSLRAARMPPLPPHRYASDPDQADFGDYRAAGGILFPFLIRTADVAPFDIVTRHFSEIRYGGG